MWDSLFRPHHHIISAQVMRAVWVVVYCVVRASEWALGVVTVPLLSGYRRLRLARLTFGEKAFPPLLPSSPSNSPSP